MKQATNEALKFLHPIWSRVILCDHQATPSVHFAVDVIFNRTKVILSLELELMRLLITAIIYLCHNALVLAGESSLTKTFQPLDGLGAGEIFIVEMTCHDWNSHSGQPTAICLISEKNVPPTNSEKAMEDINLASSSHIYFCCQDIEAAVPNLVMAADKFEAAGGRPEEAILRASLECLRRVLPAKLLKTELTFT
jgi:hypothetical protein